MNGRGDTLLSPKNLLTWPNVAASRAPNPPHFPSSPVVARKRDPPGRRGEDAAPPSAHARPQHIRGCGVPPRLVPRRATRTLPLSFPPRAQAPLAMMGSGTSAHTCARSLSFFRVGWPDPSHTPPQPHFTNRILRGQGIYRAISGFCVWKFDDGAEACRHADGERPRRSFTNCEK